MPRVAISSDYKSTNDGTDWPKLKLRTAEKARIWMPEQPWMEWYHRIEAPLIEHGEPVTEIKDRKNGSTFETWKMDWIGNVFCLGETGTPENPGPLMLKGIDPDNCPVCESAARSTGVRKPEQRFAANVVKYKLRHGTYNLITPVSAEVLVWAFTARVYGTLFELQDDFGELRKVDIKLECEDTPGADKWQRMKQIGVIVTDGRPAPAYADAKVRSYVQDLYGKAENRATDDQLRDACLGRDVARPVLMDMVRRAESQWRQAEQAGPGGSDSGAAAQADSGFNGSLAEGIDSLLDSGPKAVEDPTTEFRDDPLADPTATGATTTGTAAPVAESPSRTEPRSAPPASGSTDSDPLPDDERVKAVEEAADDMFGPAAAEPASAEPSLAPPEPAPVAAPAGGVLDFDDLFKD